MLDTPKLPDTLKEADLFLFVEPKRNLRNSNSGDLFNSSMVLVDPITGADKMTLLARKRSERQDGIIFYNCRVTSSGELAVFFHDKKVLFLRLQQ